MKKNRGFTLIEMMLVIGIAGILAGSSILALNNLKYANTKKCVNDIDSMLDKVRVICMTKAPTYLYIYMDGGTCYMQSDDGTFIPSTDRTVLSRGDITITACSDDSPSFTKTVSASNSIRISFKRSNGALEKDTIDARYYNRILIQRDSRTYTINIAKMTGKHFIEE